MNSVRPTRRVCANLAMAAMLLLPIALSGCNNNLTIPGWSCGGYNNQTVPRNATLSGMVFNYVHYTPHNSANTNEIVTKIQVKYGYLGGIHAGQIIRIPWGCVRS